MMKTDIVKNEVVSKYVIEYWNRSKRERRRGEGKVGREPRVSVKVKEKPEINKEVGSGKNGWEGISWASAPCSEEMASSLSFTLRVILVSRKNCQHVTWFLASFNSPLHHVTFSSPPPSPSFHLSFFFFLFEKTKVKLSDAGVIGLSEKVFLLSIKLITRFVFRWLCLYPTRENMC